jgi:hypothetical protein
VGVGPRGRYYVQGYGGRKICDAKIKPSRAQATLLQRSIGAKLCHAKRLELQHAGGLRTKRAIGTKEGELWPFERVIRPPGTSGGRTPFSTKGTPTLVEA